TMGSEFVPTLDEGDFVIQPVLKTGTSLSKTVEITTEIEKILLKKFPEVQQVVTRIGAAEVPTDPMSMEESDVIIKLAPKGEWTSADSKDELADKFKEALAVIPGMEVEFTQPIEMRFNELITGVRADIAIKIFGPDLDVLAKKGSEIGNLIKNVEGAADISVEKIAGLPEMSVNYDRAKIARFGLNIQELNDMVSMGFAGKTAGSVFEGEKRFDLVVRLDKAKRQDIDDLKNLYVDLPMGGKVPLTELAEISYKQGAAKTSRDDTKRRTVVGVNVRNRDLQSVVDDVQQLINEKVKLPAGYTITYGGQFENLQSARDRLIIAVPIALVLIFALLYFAFKSVKEALIIYSAIPLAAVGGVLLLWMRGLPFSISAGVGFIALFGIAVLNGIVLIEHFKELKKHSFDSLDALIKQGTKDRLRAVLLTASAAALGFLPMAISTNAGAEVQRPLATVVIGGLFTATILTLVVLPVLYSIFDKYENSRKPIPKTTLQNGIAFIALLITVGVSAQETKGQNLDELLSLAIENNMGLKAGKLKVEESQSMINSAFNFNKTHVYYEYDENNLAINDVPLKVFGVQQDFRFPTEYFSQKRVNKVRNNLVQTEFDIQSKAIERDVTIGYYEYQIAREKVRVYKRLDSLYANFSSVAARKFELGETNYLEKITAASKQRKINLDYQQAIQQVSIAYANLLRIVQVEDSLELSEEMNLKIDLKAITVESTPEIAYYETNMQLMAAESNFEKQQLLPDISVAYFQGSNSELNDNLIGYQLGLKIPLLFSGQAARIKASKIAKERAVTESIDYKIQIKSKQEILLEEIAQIQNSLNYYENEGTELSDEILKTAQISFKNGEIDFYQYRQSLESAYDIKLGYL
ncbi:MAG: efflux RND transporter permease subunit, partial [Maribacter stanieri]